MSDMTGVEPSAESARHLQLLATMETMRRLGVTRYRAGDLEIELAPAAAVSAPAGGPDQLALRAEMVHRVAELLQMPGASDGDVLAAALEFVMAERGTFEDTQPRPRAGYPQRVPAGSPDEPVGKCLKSVAMGLCAREHGHSGLCSRDGEAPTPEPPDEQPAVEIDFAATEELLRAQDARRRGQGA